MVYEHWSLRESPFRGDLDPRFFYQSQNAEEVLARLHFLPEQRRRLGLLLGNSGVGKSQLLQIFARQLREEGYQVANLRGLCMGSNEFLLLLAAEFGMLPSPSASNFTLWRMIDDHLKATRYQEIGTVLLLDDADEADPAVLACVTRLVHSDPTPAARLSAVLAVREEARDIWASGCWTCRNCVSTSTRGRQPRRVSICKPRWASSARAAISFSRMPWRGFMNSPRASRGA